MNYEKLNRTRIHLILFSPFYLSMLIAGIKGWQSPISCEDVPEGMEQRIVPTGMAVRDNEVKRHRNFSKKHFSGVAACGFRLVGHDGGAVRDEAVPVYVTRFGDSAKRQILENGGLVPLFSEIKKFVLPEG